MRLLLNLDEGRMRRCCAARAAVLGNHHLVAGKSLLRDIAELLQFVRRRLLFSATRLSQRERKTRAPSPTLGCHVRRHFAEISMQLCNIECECLFSTRILMGP